MRVLLIDGLNLIRRIYAGVPGDEGGGEHREGVLSSIRGSLMRALDQVAPSHAMIVFEYRGSTWRHELNPSYKAGRKPMPVALVELLPQIEVVFAASGVGAVRVPEFEADDVIASIAMKLVARTAEVVVLTTDKGFLPLLEAGVRVRNHFDEREFDAAYVAERFGVTPRFLNDYLALVGDRAQGIPGVASIGAKTAAQLVQTHGSLEQILAAAQNLEGRIGKALCAGSADAQLSLRLVSMRTDVATGLNLSEFRLP